MSSASNSLIYIPKRMLSTTDRPRISAERAAEHGAGIWTGYVENGIGRNKYGRRAWLPRWSDEGCRTKIKIHPASCFSFSPRAGWDARCFVVWIIGRDRMRVSRNERERESLDFQARFRNSRGLRAELRRINGFLFFRVSRMIL